jgi:hypothetical protein
LQSLVPIPLAIELLSERESCVTQPDQALVLLLPLGKPGNDSEISYCSPHATTHASFRTENRQQRLRRLLSRRDDVQLKLMLSKVGYVLDMTPTREGDDAAALLGDLSLTRGLKSWCNAAWFVPERSLSLSTLGLAKKPNRDKTAATVPVPEALVSGHDEMCRCDGHVRHWDFSATPCITPQVLLPSFRDIQDYCEVRHRANIVRLLRFLCKQHDDQPNQLLINSAGRMWTLVHIANFLEVTDAIVRSPSIAGLWASQKST